MTDDRDAVRYHLKGNWRMMSYKEAQAFKDAVDVRANNNNDGIIYSKNGIELEFKMIGSILDNKNLNSNLNPKNASERYWKTIFIWSRDFETENYKPNIYAGAYVYGANKTTEKGQINFLYGDHNGTTSTVQAYWGNPSIPCLVVSIKKANE